MLTGTEYSFTPGCESKGEMKAIEMIGVNNTDTSSVFSICQNRVSVEKELVREGSRNHSDVLL